MTLAVLPEPFDPNAALAAFMAAHPDAGAMASFVGICRGHTNGEAVTALILEHFEGFTQSEIARIMAACQARFAVTGLLVMHRTGRVLPGEPIVLAAAASAHRRAAFEAVDFLMDYLKSEAPFWKKEEGPLGARWVEPRVEDLIDKTRWSDEREA
jgi:molybdopterin synthase catalytic subunit